MGAKPERPAPHHRVSQRRQRPLAPSLPRRTVRPRCRVAAPAPASAVSLKKGLAREPGSTPTRSLGLSDHPAHLLQGTRNLGNQASGEGKQAGGRRRALENPHQVQEETCIETTLGACCWYLVLFRCKSARLSPRASLLTCRVYMCLSVTLNAHGDTGPGFLIPALAAYSGTCNKSTLSAMEESS